MSSPSPQQGEQGPGGLKRTNSRGNLVASGGGSGKGTASMAAFRAAAAASGASQFSSANASSSTPASSVSPGLLKRSRSMGTFDSFIARDTSGRDAVEAISASGAASARPPQTSLAPPRPAAPPQQAVVAPPPAPEEPVVSSSSSSSSLSSNTHDVLTSPLDDSQIHHEPLARVDYFSHDWSESDLSSSWRYIVSRRQEMANSARLENASWRTWAKAKYNLKTVSPESLNWLKDYDVTWLYGPLYHEPSSSAPATCSQTDLPPRTTSETDAAAARAATAVSVPPSGTSTSSASGARAATRGVPKSILKKKTLAQIMLEDTPGYVPSNAGPSTGSETTNYLRHHIYRQVPTGQNRERMAALLNRQYGPSPSSTSPQSAAALAAATAAASIASPAAGLPPNSPLRPPSNRTASQASAASIASISSTNSQGSCRRVHFNDRVEQCIALDIAESAPCSPEKPSALDKTIHETNRPVKFDEDDDEDGDEDDEEDDEGGLFLGMRRHDLYHDTGSHTIIAPLPATTLKYDDEDLEPDTVTPPPPPSRGVRAGFNANYDYSSVYKIVDPHVKAVPMAHETSKTERKVRPVASFGLNKTD